MAATECDVLIIGSGIGGITAAIQAKLAGLQPILCEKLPLIGGSSALSGGVLWLPNNPLMAREGVEDSREAALTYIANFAPADDPGSTVARREAFVDAVAPLVALYESEGVPLLRCEGYSDYYDTLPGGCARGRALEAEVYNANRLGTWKDKFRPQNFPVPARASESGKLMLMNVSWAGKKKAAEVGWRAVKAKLTGQSIRSAGAALQGRLLEVALRLGCDIRVNAGLLDLDQEGGKVVGARLKIDGREEHIRARRGVVIAAGGFARNTAMRQQYQKAPISDRWTHSNEGETGEAIQAMTAAGAALGWMDEAWWTTSVENHAVAAGSNQIIPELHKPHAIVVGADGQRFVNEAQSYMEVGRACYARNEVTKAIPAWVVMDQQHRKRYVFGFAMPGKIPKEWLAEGNIKVADTLEALAARCGIDPAGLASTVSRWNGMCVKGVDEDFGKGSSAYNRWFGDATVKPNPCMGTIEKGPFWAAPLHVGDVGTCGGAVTDEHARVKRPDGSVIEGLYAAGNCASPLAGPYYIGAGHSIGCSAVFGMVAARHMANGLD
jgi:3-oxosteroid 1-dehydrogenase